MSCIFRGRCSTLETIIIIMSHGRRSTLDVSCCAFCVNRIVRAAWSNLCSLHVAPCSWASAPLFFSIEFSLGMCVWCAVLSNLTVEQWNSETVSGRLQSATDEDHLPRKNNWKKNSSKIKPKIDQASCHATIAGHPGSAIVFWQLKINAAESVKQAPTQLKLQWTADSEQPNRSHLLFQKWANCCSIFMSGHYSTKTYPTGPCNIQAGPKHFTTGWQAFRWRPRSHSLSSKPASSICKLNCHDASRLLSTRW